MQSVLHTLVTLTQDLTISCVKYSIYASLRQLKSHSFEASKSQVA